MTTRQNAAILALGRFTAKDPATPWLPPERPEIQQSFANVVTLLAKAVEPPHQELLRAC
jgi:hypothetical protein